MKMILLGILLGIFPFCLGFPALNARQEALSRAMKASLEELNRQYLGRNLLKLSSTGATNVKPLLWIRDQRSDEDAFEVNLQFSVRETTCDKDTTTDPSKCEFIRSYMETPCESKVLVSGDKALVGKASCNRRTFSSSESNSSEEKFWRLPNLTQGRGRSNTEKFPSHWDPYGRRIQNINPRWEEEDNTLYPLMHE